MTSPERRKGSAFEVDVVKFLRSAGHPFAERAYGAGRPDDVGDVNGIVGWCLELKNHKTMDLAGWADEAAREATAARCRWWAVIAKRRNRPTADAYVVMPLSQFAELMADG
jgi:Holliday junction resolvase